MGKKRKPLREVELEDIVASVLKDSDSNAKDIILKTLLELEALLIEHIQLFKINESVPFQFPKKCDLLVNVGAISEATGLSYKNFNKLRNDCIHLFGFQIDLPKLRELISSLESNGIDFSDSPNNYSDENALEFFDGIRGIASYIGWNLLEHQAVLLSLSGVRDIYAAP